MNNVARYIVVLLIFVSSWSWGQDLHFSQYMYAPFNHNPSYAGLFDGDWRFHGNGRQQWRSVTVPYETYAFTADTRSLTKLEQLGTGLTIINDRAGDSQYNTFKLNLAGAYHLNIKDTTNIISIGLQSGFSYRNIDDSKLYFDEAWDGSRLDFNYPNSEDIEMLSYTFLNLNVGMSYTKKLGERKQVTGGISYYNISRPNQSFFINDLKRLDGRIDVSVSGQYPINENLDFLPALNVMSQGKFKEINAGASLKYILNHNPAQYRSVHLGVYSRLSDAAVILLGMDYNDLFAGLSYDVNYSNLKPSSNKRGAIEFSLIYIIRNVLPERERYRICPNYM